MRMCKRAGNIVTLDDLVDDGRRRRGALLARPLLDRLAADLDLDLLTRQTNDNPVFYVQYAHARIASLLRNAADLGIDVGGRDASTRRCSATSARTTCCCALGEFPRVVATAAELREPHRVARYLEELAGTYHRFYDACRVLPKGDEPATDLHTARLWLMRRHPAVVLANGLGLLGVSRPGADVSRYAHPAGARARRARRPRPVLAGQRRATSTRSIPRSGRPRSSAATTAC